MFMYIKESLRVVYKNWKMRCFVLKKINWFRNTISNRLSPHILLLLFSC